LIFWVELGAVPVSYDVAEDLGASYNVVGNLYR
ncbi:hypothetical protein TIFTF001_030811, partial [Ficus carica]